MIEFYSFEGTTYKWYSEKETLVNLTPLELQMIKKKVSLMSDKTILNRESGNNIKMGIPVVLHKEKLAEVYRFMRRMINKGSEVMIEAHAVDRLLEDYILPDGDSQKRGWSDEHEVRNCVRSMHRIVGLRLNVDHNNKKNTINVKHLFPQIGITIEGKKQDGNGRVVTAVLTDKSITVITIL
ncbi:hypothetical protein D7Z54_07370 [Salibacterium salarium]|uniref:Uncharacterized protein n=1 Tax=Salibacterium salarium TaxID=284579 RepID=A0A3R9PM91_9BACI|nr:hypothetical protein [Salibacterium salarium]RSL33929.1 hypothetical protein D7Z54_07370 [Salibacterium salarium]